MTFAENRTYGVPEFAGTEVNRHYGKLKGLSGYLQNHYPMKELRHTLLPHTAAKIIIDMLVLCFSKNILPASRPSFARPN